MHHRKQSCLFGVVSIGILAALLGPAFDGAQAQGAAPSKNGDGIGTPKFTRLGSVTNFSATARTIPYFRSQFTDPTNGRTYPYTMVGTDPGLGDVTTTIPAVIIPISFNFEASTDPNFHVLNAWSKTVLTIDSPVFQPSDVGAAASATASAPPSLNAGRTVNEPSDVTQLGDAIYRAQWGRSGSGYHVLLGQPTVLATQSFTVPKNLGFIVVGSRSRAHIGLLDIGWFSNRLNQAISSLHIDPGTLPIVLVYNVFLYAGNDPGNCCYLGYHSASVSLQGNGHQQVQTFLFASYSDPGIFGAHDGDAESFVTDIHALSHEVQEWYDDPFINNVVNPWLTPTAPQYGCTSFLETGDPIVGYGFKITLDGTTYHPEDEVHYSWFARESPSRAASGYFTYLNNFATAAEGCNSVASQIEAGQSGLVKIAAPLGDGAPAFSLRAPNPMSSDFSLTLSLPSPANARLAVYDIAGRAVLSREVGTRIGSQNVSLSRLPVGIYVVRLTQAGRSLSQRFAVLH